MPYHIDASKWKDSGVDVIYKDPFSALTTSIRKKLIFFASLVILHSYYPINLSESHILGIKFKNEVAPPLSVVIGIVVLYFTALLTIYTIQEIKSWLAQSNTLNFERHKEALEKIASENKSIHTAVNSATEQLKMHSELSVYTHEELSPEQRSSLEVHLKSFTNFVNNLSDSNTKFENSINNAQLSYDQSLSDYRTAFYTQIIKVGILEILLPFGLALVALSLTISELYIVLSNA